ncbi:hypothetical protein STCU_10151 [Strigomonas culicis]|uniref:Uncharacterized protein n=1 Tax=Strigomonas culicis TaxID=28005 RepID=S9TP31_9TRYP|nr:hypothetical protein STCU_10151 [Strigomonas culicis]|eukprot:EPY18158.1 hypothetical protein STCU_10151 [Strigomonas culicis]
MDAFRSAKGVSVPQVTTVTGMKSLAEWDGSEEMVKFLDTQTVSLGARKMDAGTLGALVARLDEVGSSSSSDEDGEETDGGDDSRRRVAQLRQKGRRQPRPTGAEGVRQERQAQRRRRRRRAEAEGQVN